MLFSLILLQPTHIAIRRPPSVFVIEASEPEVPEGLISILKLLRMSEEEWAKTKLKSKPPKPSLDFPSAAAASSLLESRLAEYPTTFDVRHHIQMEFTMLMLMRLQCAGG